MELPVCYLPDTPQHPPKVAKYIHAAPLLPAPCYWELHPSHRLADVQTQRLRFDFNLPRGMTGKEVRQVEQLVNSWIQQDHSLSTHVVPLQEAKDKGQSSGCCSHAPAGGELRIQVMYKHR